jgi:hypothetical protein
MFATGIYGTVKVVATAVFLVLGIDRFGRKKSLIAGGRYDVYYWRCAGDSPTSPWRKRCEPGQHGDGSHEVRNPERTRCLENHANTHAVCLTP